MCAFTVSIILPAFESVISQSRCFLKPKSFLRGLCSLKSLLRVSEHLPPRALSFVETRYACFSSDVYCWIISVFYLDIIKQHEINLSAEKSSVLFGISQYIKYQACSHLQNLAKLYNHFLFVVKNFYSVMVLTC